MESNFTVVEEINTLRNASYLLDTVTRLFIVENNHIGSYNDEIASRFEDGLYFIHELMDREYKAVQKRLEQEIENAK